MQHNPFHLVRFIDFPLSTTLGEVSPAFFATVTNMEQGRDYQFLARAHNQHGFNQNPQSVPTFKAPYRPPLSVTLLRGAPHTNGRISLSWQTPANNDSGAILSYRVSWSKVGDGGSAGSVSVAASATGVVALNGAPWYEPYEYVVRASNSVGLGLPATLTATPLVSPIARPALNVVAVDHANGAAEVTVGVVSSDSYRDYPVGWIEIPLYYSPSPTISPADTAHHVFDRLISVDINTTLGEVVGVVITVTGLQEGARYAFFRPKFRNQYGFSQGGNVEVSMSLSAPSPVTVLRGANHTNGRISLSWQPPATNIFSGIQGYRVSWSKASDGGSAGDVIMSPSPQPALSPPTPSRFMSHMCMWCAPPTPAVWALRQP